MTEQWKDVEGYEGIYRVSNTGRVQRHPMKTRKYFKERRLIHSSSKFGYVMVTLSKNNVVSNYTIHRLVAIAFKERKPGCDIVRHLDNNPKNNNDWNLEWGTQSDNIQQAFREGRKSAATMKGRFGANHNRSKYYVPKALRHAS